MVSRIVDRETVMESELAGNGSGPPAPRKVSVGLIVGIALAAPIFVWFLLRQGYSATARVAGFAWIAFLVVLQIAVQMTPGPDGAVASDTAGAGLVTATPTPETAGAAYPARSPAVAVVAKPGRMPGQPDCTLTHETPGWETVKTNAILTAERYALERNPAATFGNADGDVVWQIDGPHKGLHTLIISNDQVALAQLVPTFDFCTPADRLDPEGPLWKVVLAKLDGKEF